MAMFKVTVTAKAVQGNQRGSFSRVFEYDHEPVVSEIKGLRRDATDEYAEIYHATKNFISVDISVRPASSEERGSK